MKLFGIVLILLSFLLHGISSLKIVDEELVLEPRPLCKQQTTGLGVMVIWTYVSSKKVYISHGPDNLMTLGKKVIEEHYPTLFLKNDDQPIVLPLSQNFKTRSQHLFYFNISNNPHHIPLSLIENKPALFSKSGLMVDDFSTKITWKLGSKRITTEWFNDLPLCCTSLCSHLTYDLQCLPFPRHFLSISNVSVHQQEHRHWIYLEFISDFPPWEVRGAIKIVDQEDQLQENEDAYQENNSLSYEPDSTFLPFKTISLPSQLDDSFTFLSSNNYPLFVKEHEDVKGWFIYNQTFHLPDSFGMHSDHLQFCLQSNCEMDCVEFFSIY